MLARQAAREHGGSDLLGLAAFGAANGLIAAGELGMAQAELDSVTVPTTMGCGISSAEQGEGARRRGRTSILCSVDETELPPG